jgi:hypothetical protein
MLTADAIVAIATPADPIRCGIYFLIRDGQIVYVGQSIHITARIANHALLKQFDSWAWTPCEVDALDALERAYINALMPDDNRDHVTQRRRKPPSQWQIDAENARRAEAERVAQEEEDERQWTERMRVVAATLG